MDVHEYQAKEILRSYGIFVPPFAVVSHLSEVEAIIERLDLKEAVLKVQIHAGGRGKAGGVRFAKSREEILQMADQMLDKRIVTKQTGKEGALVKKLLLSPPLTIEKEYYLAASIDRERARPILIASPQGGMEIEEVANRQPEQILQIPIELTGEIKTFRLTRLLKFMGWEGDLASQGASIARALAKAFIETDASLLEINPLVLACGSLQALDAKLSVDDNALFRQPKIAAMYDPIQSSVQEVEAKAFDLAYVAMEGNIGCMVNGAGLAMATMDLIHYYGGKPANFLDVGGGASKEKVSAGFKIILEDPKVEAILVNIFGGIMDCGVLARGIIEAAQECFLRVPLIVRMEGTNVEEARRLLADSRLPILPATSLEEAAQKAVSQIKKGEGYGHLGE